MAIVRTNFSAHQYGFRFRNSFDFSVEYTLPFTGPINLGDVVYGLCGGMSFAALDHFYAGKSVPVHVGVADVAPGFFTYLWDRQLDSLRLPVVLRVIEWMLREDDDVSRLTARYEVPKLRSSIDKGKPVVLALIRVKGIDNPTHNHQVIATGYDFDPPTKQLTIYLYDPNYPGKEPTLTMNLGRPSRGIELAQSTGEAARGFFIISYKPQAVA